MPSVDAMLTLLDKLRLSKSRAYFGVDLSWLNGNFQRALFHQMRKGDGQTCAKMFAQQGARVVLTGRRVTQGEKVVRNMVAAGGDGTFQACDVTETESVKEAVRQTVAAWGSLISCSTTQADRRTQTARR